MKYDWSGVILKIDPNKSYLMPLIQGPIAEKTTTKTRFPDSIVRLSNVIFHFVLSYVEKSGNQRQHAEGLPVLA
jgi:hypothetical protein